MNESESISTSKNWGVVLLSVPSKHKKGVVKNLEEIFKLDKHDAEKILSNAPLILVDDLPLELATHVRDFFRKAGVSAESTNHEVIKKNYWKVRWPEPPDLSFFMKYGTGSAAISPEAGKAEGQEPDPGVSQSYESQGIGFQTHPDTGYQLPEASVSGGDSDWAQRVSELDGKLRKIHREKVEAQEQRVEAIEKLKMESRMQLEEEKRKREELAAKAAEDLQKEAEKIKALTGEKEEWYSKAVTSGEKVQELEANLLQRGSEIENLTRQREDLIRQKEELSRQAERAAAEAQQEISALRVHEQELLRKIEELERNVRQMAESLRFRDNVLAQFEKQIQELAAENSHHKNEAQ